MYRELRKQICFKRAKLSPKFQEKVAEKTANIIYNNNIFKNSKHIACYISIQGEVNPAPLIELMWKEKKICYLPILDPTKNNQLLFTKFKEKDTLINNRYGIPEPKFDTHKLINPKDIDIVITPLVAFDLHANRLGKGCGYYDRTFAFLKQQSPKKKPYLIGLAYELQKVSNLSPKPWDVPLDMIVTEKQCYPTEQDKTDSAI